MILLILCPYSRLHFCPKTAAWWHALQDLLGCRVRLEPRDVLWPETTATTATRHTRQL